MSIERQHSGLTRRTFLATSALSAGALAVASATGCSSVDTDAPVEAGGEAATETDQVFTSACRGNCGGQCVLEVHVREGKVVSTMNQTYDDAPLMTRGCVKGVSNIARLYGTGRVAHPLKRVEGSERGAGEWEQITWDEAFQLVAEKIQASIDEHGGKSVGVWRGGGGGGYINGYYGPGNYRMSQKFGFTHLEYNADMCGGYMQGVLGQGSGSVEDYQYSKTIVLWGANPAAALNDRSAWHWVCKARENGAKLVTIDPLFSESAAQSDKWYPVRVGTDGALICGMIHHIVDNNLFDEDYLRNKSIAPFLVKEDGSYLRLSDLGMELEDGVDPATGEAAKVDSPVVWDEAASSFVSHTAATNPAYTGARDANGVNVRTAYDISIESIRPFDLDYAVNETGLSKEDIIELTEICLESKPTRLSIGWGIEHTHNAFHLYKNLGLLVSLIGCKGEPGAGYTSPNFGSSCIWKRPPAPDMSYMMIENPQPMLDVDGESIIDIMKTGKYGDTDLTFGVVINSGHNPIDNDNAPLEIIDAWNKGIFVVTLDSFMTSSALYSDLVLPITMQFERSDIFAGGPGYVWSGEFQAQIDHVEPLGEAKDDYEIWQGIAQAMGCGDVLPLNVDEIMHQYLDTPDNIAAGLAYDDYAAAGGVILDEYTYNEVESNEETNQYGRTQFYLEQFVPRYDIGRPLGENDNKPYYEEPIEAYLANPDREKYPLFGFFNHDLYHGQSMHGKNVWLDQFRTHEGTPYCRIHETAAAERGIKTGDTVRCYNDHGSVVLKAVVTKGIQKDSVWLPHGFYADEFIEGFAQTLSGHYTDPQTLNSNFNDMILEVEKYEGGAA